MSSCAGGSGPDGGSTHRIRNHIRSSDANAASPCRPVVRKARSPSDGSIRAASASDAASCQLSCAPAVQGGRTRLSSGVPVCAHAAAAFAEMPSAKG